MQNKSGIIKRPFERISSANDPETRIDISRKGINGFSEEAKMAGEGVNGEGCTPPRSSVKGKCAAVTGQRS